ncbi:hypothetical protein FRC09_011098 [Ceratobasidium sp. 395]|nr:hypothetical protein FRC09_011098 [Ceratobasidium sp. 395]
MDVPFARFVEFVDTVGQGKDCRLTFERWNQGLPKDLGPAVFRLLFPELDVARRFSFSESRLAKTLATILRTPSLSSFVSNTESGCLGSSIATVLPARRGPSRPGITLRHVDELLSDLAALSPWSHQSFRARRKRPELDILSELYADAEPQTAAVLTQLILKSIHPLLYPNKSKSAHTSDKSPRKVLTIREAMRAWDPRMARIYQVRADLTVAAQTLLKPSNDTTFGPLLGVPIEIPKCFKARSIRSALNVLNSSSATKAFAEVKYDGERIRMQIHVDLSKPIQNQIIIFSKSKRDSTRDRAGTHPIIRAALGLPPDPQLSGINVSPLLAKRIANRGDRTVWPEHLPETLPATHNTTRTVKDSVILECEMVAYDELRGKVDEFWRVRNLVESTALGVRARKEQEEPEPDSIPSNSTLSQPGPEPNIHKPDSHNTCHLALIFFDILSLDGVSLLDKPFEQRRTLLEQVVQCVPGWVGISNGRCINLTQDNNTNTETQDSSQNSTHPAHEALVERFGQVIADYEEGLVVKPCSGRYNDRRAQWVKMKKDYIPGLGDCADFVVIGAGHDRERGRELGVGPNVLTTFYIGVRTNEDNLAARAMLDTVFTVSYGLSRDQLEDLNHRIQSVGAYETYRTDRAVKGRYMRIPYDVRLARALKHRPPRMWFLTPMLFELMGAGFTKLEESGHYEIRFPRITKIHSPTDRPWMCGLGNRSLQRLANVSLGLEGTEIECAEEVVDRIWGDEGNGGVSKEEKRKERVEKWVKALGGKKPREQAIIKAQSGTDMTVAQSVGYTLDDSNDALGCASDREGITGDELELSDTELRESEGGNKRTRVHEDMGREEREDLRATEVSWKRLRLASPGPPSIPCTDDVRPSLGNLTPSLQPTPDFDAGLEDIPNNPLTPTHTESSIPSSSPSQLINSPPRTSRVQRSQSVQSCASSPENSACLPDPHLLLADAFIYVAHRSAPHPTSLVPASHRVFSQEALLAGLDWTGEKRKRRRALEAHIPTNQVNKMAGIRKGVVIVDYRRDDTRAIVNRVQSLGTSVHAPHFNQHMGKTMLCVVAPKEKHFHDYDCSTDGLELDVLCIVTPYSS